jgi:hypothetical protein
MSEAEFAPNLESMLAMVAASNSMLGNLRSSHLAEGLHSTGFHIIRGYSDSAISLGIVGIAKLGAGCSLSAGLFLRDQFRGTGKTSYQRDSAEWR